MDDDELEEMVHYKKIAYQQPTNLAANDVILAAIAQ
jgi:hypothetical protein